MNALGLGQFAVLNSSRALSTDDVLFMADACARQNIEIAAAWGVSAMPAAVYADPALLPADDVVIAEIVDDLDQPGALGYHALAGRPYVRVLAQGPDTSITLSHEFAECLIDPTCDGWRTLPDGTQVALEVADPVEGDSYDQVAEVLGEQRTIRVSNYALPAWFVGGPGPYDRLRRVTAPGAMSPGGYMVVLDGAGDETEVFARVRTGSLAAAAVATRLARRNSRLLRRLRARR